MIRLRVASLAAAVLHLGCASEGAVGARVEGLTVRVPADYPTIQAALDAVTDGDTVEVAPGEYVENLYVTDGKTVAGAGPEQTTLRGFIRLDGADTRVTGLRVTATGAVGLPAEPYGFRGEAPSGVISGNVIDGFYGGVRLTGSEFAVISGNLIHRNGNGVETFEAGQVHIANNLIVHNTLSGVKLDNSDTITVAHNTIVGNGFGEPLSAGGAGVTILSFSAELVQNNILVSNRAGINALSGRGTHDHNLVWGNSTNYAGDASAGTGDLSVDPLFVNASGGDFHLREGSPAIDAGVALDTDDYDGLARPEGAASDLGAYEHRAAAGSAQLVISEVLANPVDEARGELIELVNLGDTAVDLAGLILSDGDVRDVLVARGGGSTIVAPGAYAVILDADYVSGYAIPTGVTTVVPGNTTVGNGLSTTDPITLYAADGATVLAGYAHPFDPGNGVSAERVDLAGPDVPTNWRASPCLSSAGRSNCAPVTLADGLVISEVMANPLDESSGEFVELYNGGDDPIDAAGMQLSDGSTTDAIAGWDGGTTIIPARSYAVVIDSDWPAAQLFRIDPSAILLTVADAALGNGLAMSDPVTVLSATGEVVDSYTRTLIVANGRSVEKVSLSAGDAPGNWAQSSCADGSSPGRLNCVSGATAGPRKPLVITEVMSNPLDEDTGELIELYNRGVDPVDAEGLLLSDGDAIDRITGLAGGPTLIPAGGYAVILDAEYAGEYAIPVDAVRLTTADTTLGSGLAIDDPIRLLEENGVEVIDTFRFPFNPGNGISAERVDIRAFDAPSNWTASTCASGSSPGENNCAASPTGLPKQVRITEVMANQTGVETGGGGEYVELFNAGDLSVDLAGTYLEIGPVGGTLARDQLSGRAGGPTVLAPGAYAVIVDPDYDDRYTLPSGALILTIADTNFGSAGIATTHGVALYDVDGITPLDRFRFPSDPGDGVSLYRISLTAVDVVENWAATPCGATPGVGHCGGGLDVTSFPSFWVDRFAGDGGILWYQAIGRPSWSTPACEDLIVCTGGTYGYDYRDNVPASAPFTFTNPYPGRSVLFEERSSPTDACTDPCTNASFVVDGGTTRTVPASSLGYYFVQTLGPSINSLDWYEGDPDLYYSLPPDGVLAPFVVEVP